MNYTCSDSIASLATTLGESAIAVIRISGDDLIPLFSALTNKAQPQPNYVLVTNLSNPVSGDELLDQAVLTYYKKPSSFTGEDCIEISCHGGNVVPKNILKVLYEFGIRPASPGEFSYRAFLNGKIDLIQAESISSLISAQSDFDANLSLKGVVGKNSDTLKNIQSTMKNILMKIENELDFSEGNTEGFYDVILDDLKNVQNKISSILNTSLMCNKLKDGLRVVLVGPPNSGKSSLFNSLLGYDRSIVSDIAGTTRDTVESWYSINGVSICFVDTAGVWESSDFLETKGIEKTTEEILRADILLIVDEQNPQDTLDYVKNKVKHDNVILIKSKNDISSSEKVENRKVLHVSVKNNIGVSRVIEDISNIVQQNIKSLPNSRLLSSDRQQNILQNSFLSISSILEDFHQLELDVISSSLWVAVESFESLFGVVGSEEIINDIFSQFCVGK